MRAVIGTAISALVLAACGGGEPVQTVPAPAVEPAPVGMPAEAPPASDSRIGTMNLMCGGESFRVAFLDTRAAIVSADGATTIELPKLEPSATSAPGVTTYTDGKQTFAKSGGGETPTVIRYAVGRMAFQDCAIAQN